MSGKRLRDQSGQASLEYVLILALALTASALLAKGLSQALDASVLRFGAQLEKDLKTGRAQASVYNN